MRGEDNKMKQTEIGMIPDDWEVKELGDLFEIGSSKRVFQSQWRKSGIPFYRAREIVILSEQNTVDNELFIDEDLYVSFRNQYGIPKINDLLVTGVGTLGKVYKVQSDKPFYYKDGNIICLSNRGNVDSDYVKYMYYFPTIINQINDSSGKSTVGTYTISSAKKTKIPLPPTLAEQKKIAQVLSDVDSVIATLEKLIAKKKNIKQGTMQQLLTGKKRLPGFAKSDKFKQTEIGEIPADWKVKRLEKIGSFSKGNSISKDESNTGDIPAVRYGELYTNHNDYIKEFYSHISRQVAKKSKLLKRGDLLFTCSGETKEEIGKCVAFIGNEEAYAGGDLLILSPKKNLNSLFFGFLLNTNSCVKQKSSLGQGDAVVHISTEAIKKIEIPFPPKPEQTAIANVFSDMDREIEALKAKLGKYRDLKTGMMQQLLTGRIRLG